MKLAALLAGLLLSVSAFSQDQFLGKSRYTISREIGCPEEGTDTYNCGQSVIHFTFINDSCISYIIKGIGDPKYTVKELLRQDYKLIKVIQAGTDFTIWVLQKGDRVVEIQRGSFSVYSRYDD